MNKSELIKSVAEQTSVTQEVAKKVVNATFETIEKATLSIYNLEGKLVENKSITLLNTTNDIGIHPIANEGVYLVSIEANGEQYSQKVMVN